MFASLTNLLSENKFVATWTAIGISAAYLIRRWAKGGECPKEYLEKDLSNKVVVITGGNTGIGFETAKQLGLQGAHIIIGCRSEEKANEAIKKIKNVDKNIKIEYLNLDLADLKSIEKFVKEFKAKDLPIHMLINNAGIMFCPHNTTKQGVEIQVKIFQNKLTF
jgi:short-subunit dehydrogenase